MLPKSPGHFRVACTISPTENLHQPFYFLRLARHSERVELTICLNVCNVLLSFKVIVPEICLKLSESDVDLHVAEVHLVGKALGDRLVEGVADVAQVLPDHLLAQTLPCYQEPGDCLGRIIQKALSYQILNATLRLLVENIQTSSIVPLSDHLIDSVV